MVKCYHKVGITKIRPHRLANPKTCKHILSYDANALYLSTMLHDMPCGRVVSRFLSSTFHPKSRWLFPFYFSNITLRTDVLTFRVNGAVFKIAGEMHR